MTRGPPVLLLKGASEEVNAVRFTPDGLGLLASTWRSDQLWPDWSAGGKPVAYVELPDGVSREEFSPDGRHVLGVRDYRSVILHDRAAGTDAVLDPGPQGGFIWLVELTPDGRHFVASHGGRGPCHLSCIQVHAPHRLVWNVPTPEPVAKLVFLDAGRFVSFVDVGGAYVAVVRDAATGEPVGKAQVNVPYRLEGLTVSPDRQCVVGYRATKFLVYQSADLAAAPMVVRNTSRKAFSGLAFHPAGRFLAATSNDASVKLYDTATWAVVRTFDWAIGRLRSIAFSPDGTLAAAGGDRGQVVVWDFDV